MTKKKFCFFAVLLGAIVAGTSPLVATEAEAVDVAAGTVFAQQRPARPQPKPAPVAPKPAPRPGVIIVPVVVPDSPTVPARRALARVCFGKIRFVGDSEVADFKVRVVSAGEDLRVYASSDFPASKAGLWEIVGIAGQENFKVHLVNQAGREDFTIRFVSVPEAAGVN